MSLLFQLICPECKSPLDKNTSCQKCGKTYIWLKEGKLVSFHVDSDHFYEALYEDVWKPPVYPRIPFINFWVSVRERISLSARRQRFFRRHLRGKNNLLILDVACGRGRKLFADYGKVIGLDIVLEPLYSASELYDLCVNANAFYMPFPNECFDYIVSSDFLGHIPAERKDYLYQEFRRVLKPKGRMLHVIETDAQNWHFRFAHRYPELFRKYFVEGIGGHFGLELPSKAIKRLKANGFEILEAKKIWGELWEIQGYKMVFDNEFEEKSSLITALVILSRLLSANIAIQEAVNVFLNPISALAERATPLDNGQGLMILCEKA